MKIKDKKTFKTIRPKIQIWTYNERYSLTSKHKVDMGWHGVKINQIVNQVVQSWCNPLHYLARRHDTNVRTSIETDGNVENDEKSWIFIYFLFSFSFIIYYYVVPQRRVGVRSDEIEAVKENAY